MLLVHENLAKKKLIINSRQVINELKKSIDKRFFIKPRLKLIIHSDKGTQLSSKTYKKLTENDKEFLIPSMSRENTPTNNTIAKRFMITIIEDTIYGITFKEKIQSYLSSDSNFNSFRLVINQYIKSINETPNRKSFRKISPQKHNMNSSTASILMIELNNSKAFSLHCGEYLKRHEVELLKYQTNHIISYMKELATRKDEVMNETPFDVIIIK